VDAAAAAFDTWRKSPITKRAKIMLTAADHIEANADRFAAERQCIVGGECQICLESIGSRCQPRTRQQNLSIDFNFHK